jgi:hypothetical protein
MKYYLGLQYNMLNRQLRDFGLHPIGGYLLTLITFIGASVYFFLRVKYAGYVYALVALSVVATLSETNRNKFLKTCFTLSNYYKLRLVENSLLVLPFVAVLLFQKDFLIAAFLFISSVILVRLNINTNINLTIPTPFYKRPFEFIIGFRKTYFITILSYALAIIAVSVDNFNLGIFAILLDFAICISFYTTPEDKLYVWIFSLTPKSFLKHKINVAILFSTILTLPITACLCIFFKDRIAILAGIQLLGYLYLVTVLLVKYSVFPQQVTLPRVLLIGVSFFFPPLLLGVVPFLWRQSVKRLNEVLA